MKIDNSLKSVGNKIAEEARTARDGSKSTGEGTNAPGVSVDISPLSSKLQSIEADIKSGDVTNPERVNEIKQAIADGRFKVNPEVVADRLLATVQELIRAYRA